MNRADVLKCGCYRDAVPDRGLMRWLRWPNSMGGLVMWNEADSGPMEERGWAIIDGIRGTLKRDQKKCPHVFEVWFDGDWSKSHPGPHADPSYGR